MKDPDLRIGTSMKSCDDDRPYTSDPLLTGIEFFANKLFEAFIFLGLSIIAHAVITTFV